MRADRGRTSRALVTEYLAQAPLHLLEAGDRPSEFGEALPSELKHVATRLLPALAELHDALDLAQTKAQYSRLRHEAGKAHGLGVKDAIAGLGPASRGQQTTGLVDADGFPAHARLAR
jgi:hypothetical protein